jgi:WD40 repeat protein
VRDANTGTETARMAGHSGAVLALAFSTRPGGLVSGGREGGIKLWQIETGAELFGTEGFAPVFGPSVLHGERIVASIMGHHKVYGDGDAYWRRTSAIR